MPARQLIFIAMVVCLMGWGTACSSDTGGDSGPIDVELDTGRDVSDASGETPRDVSPEDAAPEDEAAPDVEPPLECGQLRACEGSCVDVGSDPNHCGGCGRVCEGNEACVEGQCELQCESNELSCDGRCAPCEFDGAETLTCDGDQCVHFECEEGYNLCDGRCAPCPSQGESFGCDGGQCVTASCPSGQKLCDGQCVDCPSGRNGVLSCEQGACVLNCYQGYNLCGGECVPDSSQHCGASCQVCPGTANGSAVCQAGSCGLDCDVGFRECAGSCSPCPSGDGIAAYQCAASACEVAACDAGYRLCDGACCVDPPSTSTVIDDFNGRTFDIAVDSLGRPHVLLDTAYNTTDIELAMWNASTASWDMRPVQMDVTVSHERIVIDSSDRPHVLLAHSFGDYVRHAEWDGTAWQQTDVATALGVLGRGYDLVVDSQDRPIIAFADRENTAELKVARRDNGSWTTTGLGEDGDDVRLAVDSQDRPHIVYVTDDDVVRYGYQDSSGWTLEDIPTSAVDGDQIRTPVLAIDSQDTPHLLYMTLVDYGHYDTYYDLHLATKSSGSWSDEVIETQAAETGVATTAYADLAFSPSDVAHVVWRGYEDVVGASSDVNYAYENGGSWTKNTFDTGETIGRPTRIAMDRFGGAHVVYGTGWTRGNSSEYFYFP